MTIDRSPWFVARRLGIFALLGLLGRVPAPIMSAQGVTQLPTFTARTEGVLADVLVTRDGRPVPGLTAADFDLRDNGVRQVVEIVEWTDLPINVVLAFDTSASTAGERLVSLQAASHALLDGLNPGDRAALTTFSHRVVVRSPLVTPASTVSARIDEIAPLGETAILDGLYVALLTTQAESGRSLVVLCTDGRDTASWLDADDVVETARHSNAVIYAVATGGARRWAPLKALADATGGDVIELGSDTDLTREFTSILQLFRTRYVLAFTPQGVEGAGFHRLDVSVRGRGMRVKARPGYLADRGR